MVIAGDLRFVGFLVFRVWGPMFQCGARGLGVYKGFFLFGAARSGLRAFFAFWVCGGLGLRLRGFGLQYRLRIQDLDQIV